jgi:hypothetical protein
MDIFLEDDDNAESGSEFSSLFSLFLFDEENKEPDLIDVLIRLQ